MNYLTNWRVSFSILSSIGFLIVTAISARAVDPNVWEASINPQNKERFIPVELWTGADWNGQKELKIAPVDGTYRHRTSTYYIKGSVEWKHPVTGEISVVFERLNPGRNKDDDKLQLFTVNQDRTGLGRLFAAGPVETCGRIRAV